MAMNTNYGYPPSGYSSPFSSTPTGIRTQRPRFGYSGPSMYPRSHSSTSDIKAGSFSDSMINNYGTSSSRIDTTYDSENRNSYNDSYNTSGSIYYSANESFPYGETSMLRSDYSSLRDNGGVIRDNSMYDGQNMMHGYSGIRQFPHNNTVNSGTLSKPSAMYDAPKFSYNSTFGMNNTGESKGIFQKKPVFGGKKSKPYFPRKPGNPPKMATTKQQSAWRCELCSLDFTSQIPYDMHLRGSKHAKRIKAKEALTAVQSQANNMSITSPDDKKSFFCELCNVRANSSLQLQTHLEGSKHKSKLQPKETPSPQSQEGTKENVTTMPATNGKTNGSLVRSLPSDFGEPQPTKLVKYACDVCNVAVNSEIQLQQHLTSKKHQNKVEGKPVIRGKKVKKEENTTSVTETTADTPTEQTSTETSTKVLGVKTLASSFVQGETLQ